MRYLEAKALRGRYEDKALRGAPENKAEPVADVAPDPLEGVEFASSAARKLAEDEGLATADFRGQQPSSEGGFTKPDVEALVRGDEG